MIKKYEETVWCCRAVNTLLTNVRLVEKSFFVCYWWISHLVFWHKVKHLRYIIVVIVSYWPYGNLSYWYGSSWSWVWTVLVLHISALWMNVRVQSDASCEVCFYVSFPFLGFWWRDMGLVCVETPLSGMHFWLSVFSGSSRRCQVHNICFNYCKENKDL